MRHKKELTIAIIGLVIGIPSLIWTNSITEGTDATIIKLWNGECMNIDEQPIICTNVKSKNEIVLRQPTCIIQHDSGYLDSWTNCGRKIGDRVRLETNVGEIFISALITGISLGLGIGCSIAYVIIRND